MFRNYKSILLAVAVTFIASLVYLAKLIPRRGSLLEKLIIKITKVWKLIVSKLRRLR